LVILAWGIHLKLSYKFYPVVEGLMCVMSALNVVCFGECVLHGILKFA